MDARQDMHDVIIHYCGHGDLLLDHDKTLYLSLKGTKPQGEVRTGLAFEYFVAMMEDTLSRTRCTFVLDCCYWPGQSVPSPRVSSVALLA